MSESFLRRAARLCGCTAVCTVGLIGADLRIPEAQAKHSAVTKPLPTISSMARSLRVSGHVEVEVAVDETGSVTDVKPTQGPPVLSVSVVDAVKKWKFTPFADSSGAPSKAVTTLSFDFKQ